jgi:hypothetical protein
MPAPSIDPLAIDSRGWNPRDSDHMYWEGEPMLAFIAPPTLTGASNSVVIEYARAYDFDGWMDAARVRDIKIRRTYYRWDAPALALEREVENCPCRNRAFAAWRNRPEPRFGRFMEVACFAGEAICGRSRILRIGDLWHENGDGCPWVDCDRNDPRAVKWIVAWDNSVMACPV